MSPQRKGVVPDDLAARLEAARVAYDAARTERDLAIVAAMRAGGSVNEVSRIMDMSNAGVHAIAKAHGWPSEAEQARRAKMRTDAHRNDHLFPAKAAAAEAERLAVAREHERQEKRRGG